MNDLATWAGGIMGLAGAIASIVYSARTSKKIARMAREDANRAIAASEAASRRSIDATEALAAEQRKADERAFARGEFWRAIELARSRDVENKLLAAQVIDGMLTKGQLDPADEEILARLLKDIVKTHGQEYDDGDDGVESDDK